MLKIKHLFVAVAAFACTAVSAQTKTTPAQEEAYDLGYSPYPYWFIQAHGGAGTTFTSGKNILDLVTPSYGLSVGRMFTPVVGARINAHGYESKGYIKSIDQKYKYKFVNSTIDLMFNVTNLFRNTYNHAFNAYLIGGVGLNYAWDNDEFSSLSTNRKISEDLSNAWGKNTNRSSLFGHAVHASILLDYNVAKKWSVGLEGDICNLSDRFNSKYNNSDDWMLTAQVTVTYKFGFKKAERPAPEPEPVVEPEPAPVPPAPVVVPEPEPEPDTVAIVEEKEPLREVVTFNLRQTNGAIGQAEAVQRVKEWCEKYPEKKITVDAYADRGTGNPRINKVYSANRAKSMVAALKKAGIPANRLIVTSHGDAVQPFSDNDSNRCVIVAVKED